MRAIIKYTLPSSPETTFENRIVGRKADIDGRVEWYIENLKMDGATTVHIDLFNHLGTKVEVWDYVSELN